MDVDRRLPVDTSWRVSGASSLKELSSYTHSVQTHAALSLGKLSMVGTWHGRW